MYSFTGVEIKFLRRAKPTDKSYLVEITKTIFNDRPAHVETEINDLEGKIFTLGERQVKQIGSNVSVIYIVNGVTNGKHQAHITVYFGPQNGTEKNY